MDRYQDKEIVFDTHWFKKHQSKILWLANSWIGKYIFKFKKMGHYLDKNKKIAKITPYSVAQFNGFVGKKKKKAEYTEHFFSRNEYARKLYFYLLPLWYVMHIWDWFVADHFQLAPQLSFGFSTLTQYPGSIGANNPCDGNVLRNPTQESWATIIAGAGNSSNNTQTTAEIFEIRCGTTTNNFIVNLRGIYCFDTSSLTSGAIISTTILSLYGQSVTNYMATPPTIDIYTVTPASTSSISNSDYGQFGSTSQSGSPIDYNSYSTSGYNNWTFNATGRGNVSKTGISKFGCRTANYDVAGTVPAWGSGSVSYAYAYMSENGSNKPKLVVTYTVPSGPSNLKSLNTNLKANIKSINTNLIANVKTYDTII